MDTARAVLSSADDDDGGFQARWAGSSDLCLSGVLV
jgi:hypothetical protein